METIAQKIKKLPQTPYQRIAVKCNTTARYVSLIARGLRKPKRGKGLMVKQELDKYIKKHQ